MAELIKVTRNFQIQLTSEDIQKILNELKRINENQLPNLSTVLKEIGFERIQSYLNNDDDQAFKYKDHIILITPDGICWDKVSSSSNLNRANTYVFNDNRRKEEVNSFLKEIAKVFPQEFRNYQIQQVLK